MRWPWTSVARLDDRQREVDRLNGEIGWLRDQVEWLQDRLDRHKRADARMPETPPKPRKPLEAMPEALAKYISTIGNPSLKRQAEREARARHARGESWESIINETTVGRPIDPEEALSGQ